MDKIFEKELTEYIIQGEPKQKERSLIWKTAIGLQDVDHLSTSEYLLQTAKDHIVGKIDIDSVQTRINSYYETRTDRKTEENDTEEADKVSARIAKILGEQAFQFSPTEFITIHKRLFEGLLPHAGKIRNYNITKKEWVLNGETVIYSSYNSIYETLEYDFKIEKSFSYKDLSTNKIIEHIVEFTSNIWQIHPFGEGNTRTTAIFIIKYLNTLGFKVGNEVFANHSCYFRNALVRANYNDFSKGIHSTNKYLILFFENLMSNKNYELKNRYLHVDYEVKMSIVNVGVNVGVKLTKKEQEVLAEIQKDNSATAANIANQCQVTTRAIERAIKSLKEKGIIGRFGSDKAGHWIIKMGGPNEKNNKK